jgi:hypothetical protein
MSAAGKGQFMRRGLPVNRASHTIRLSHKTTKSTLNGVTKLQAVFTATQSPNPSSWQRAKPSGRILPAHFFRFDFLLYLFVNQNLRSFIALHHSFKTRLTRKTIPTE